MRTSTLLLCLALLLAACAPLVLASDDEYYKALDLTRDATDAQIRKNYRSLAKKYHPDRNQGDAAAEKKFQAIAEAYEVLSDPDKRQKYDAYGKEGLDKNAQHAGAGSIFDAFFGGGFGRKQQQQKKGPTVNIDLSVTLKDLYLGTTIDYESSKQTVCTKCRGTGAKNPSDVKTCPVCKGQGFTIVTAKMGPGFVSQMQQPCDKCGSKGKIVTSKCSVCGGSKVMHGTDEFQVAIERGMADGEQITFARQGDQPTDIDTQPGDIVFTLRTVPHSRFTRRGNDLYMTHGITLLEALTGFKKTFKHLDGHLFKVQQTGVTQPGTVLEIPDEGMPKHEFPSEHGSLFVELIVVLPTKISAEQEKTLTALFPPPAAK